ncbi:MAG: AAA family ATPase [Methanothermobacter sp.]
MSEINLNSNYVGEVLTKNHYVPDDNIITVVFLALSLKKPILIEGPPGTGKTELSKAISRAFKREFYRIQCYEGITFEQIVGEWNYQKQLLSLEMSKIKETSEDVFQEEFFIKRPLLTSFMNDEDSVILIDEIDKADEEVESFLLQALGEKQITVNDLGTFQLNNDLLVIMTSNSQRQLLDETKDRCLYLYIDYPSFEREMEIVKSHVPEAPDKLIESVVKAIQKIRKLNLIKTPSIRASIDWVRSLIILKKSSLEEESLKHTINVVVKNEEDKRKVLKDIKLD